MRGLKLLRNFLWFETAASYMSHALVMAMPSILGFSCSQIGRCQTVKVLSRLRRLGNMASESEVQVYFDSQSYGTFCCLCLNEKSPLKTWTACSFLPFVGCDLNRPRTCLPYNLENAGDNVRLVELALLDDPTEFLRQAQPWSRIDLDDVRKDFRRNFIDHVEMTGVQFKTPH